MQRTKRKTKLIRIILAFSILLVVPKQVVMGAGTNFKDVSPSEWYYKDLIRVVELGYIKGYEDNTFKPRNNITVREFLTILSRYIDKSNQKSNYISKEDVEIDLLRTDWGYDEAQNVFKRIYKTKIQIFDLKDFNRFITREEVVFLIANALQYQNQEYTTKLLDADNIKYKAEVQIMLNKKIIQGYEDNTFKPKAYITRAETVRIMNNLVDLNVELNKKGE